MRKLHAASEGEGAKADDLFDDLLERSRNAARDLSNVRAKAWIEACVAVRLIARGERTAAYELLHRAIQANPDAGEQLARLRLHHADLLFGDGRNGAARTELAVATRDFDEGVRRAGARGLPEDDAVVGAWIAGLEADVCLRLGLIDRATQACDREAALAAGLSEYERSDNALRRMNLALAVEDFREVLSIADTHATEARAIDAAYWPRFQVKRAIAISEIARGGDAGRLAEVIPILREALPPGSDPLELGSGLQILVDVALRRGELREARKLLAELAAIARPTGAGTHASGERAIDSSLRARLLLAEGADARSLSEALTDLRACFEDVCRAWEREEAPPGGLGTLFWGTQRRVVSELVRLELALAPPETAPERALKHVLRSQRVGSLARALPGATAGCADVRAELASDGAAVLVVLPAIDRSHVFLVDSDGVVHAESAPRDQLIALAGRAWSGLADPSRSAGLAPRLVADLAELSRLLIPDAIAARVARARHLRVSGLDLCGEPPFEILPLGAHPEIGLELAISHLPSLPSAVGLARRAAARPSAGGAVDLALFADPVVDSRITARHPRARSIGLDEAELASLSIARTRIATRDDASFTALAGALRERPVMLTVLTHGIDEPERDLRSGLVLAPEAGNDGATWCEDALRLESPPFVALLACGTGRGRTRMGDDAATHWGGALLAAGSDSVLVARSDLTVRAALRLGAIIPDHVLARGAEPAVALLVARRALAADPELSDPRERALVRIVGFSRAQHSTQPSATGRDATRVEDATSWSSAWWLALAATGLVLFAMVRWISRGLGARSPGSRG